MYNILYDAILDKQQEAFFSMFHDIMNGINCIYFNFTCACFRYKYYKIF